MKHGNRWRSTGVALAGLALLVAGCSSSGSGHNVGATTAASVAASASASTGGSASAVPTAATTASSAGPNLSANAYFPLVVGATWTYRTTSGPGAGATVVDHIVSGNAGTITSQIHTTLANGTTGTVTGTYVVEPNGSVKVEASTSAAGGGSLSFSGAGTYFIPNVSQVTSCTPCHFNSNFSASFTGLAQTLNFSLTDTVTSEGMQSVTVPAGTYQAAKLLDVIDVSGGPSGFVHIASTFTVYLAANVGVVETGGGTVNTTAAGRSFSSTTGTTELVSYTP